MTELLPCPFCGGEALVCEGGINGRMMTYGLVEHKDWCFFLADGLPTKNQHIMESDFEAWNTRAGRTCRSVLKKYGGKQKRTCSECGSFLTKTGRYCKDCGARVIG